MGPTRRQLLSKSRQLLLQLLRALHFADFHFASLFVQPRYRIWTQRSNGIFLSLSIERNQSRMSKCAVEGLKGTRRQQLLRAVYPALAAGPGSDPQMDTIGHDFPRALRNSSFALR